MSTVPTSLPPVPAGKRARTRLMLIETAATLIREKGFANVSMEDVAAKAGVSRGSIYGNFRDRDELFVAVALYRMPRIAPVPMPGATLEEQLGAMGKAVAQAAQKHRGDTVYWAAYMLHVLSNEELRRRADLQGRESRGQLAREWAKAMPSDSITMPIDMFVKILSALTSSLIMAHSMSPEDYDEEVIVAAFKSLAGRHAAAKTAPKPQRAGQIDEQRRSRRKSGVRPSTAGNRSSPPTPTYRRGRSTQAT